MLKNYLVSSIYKSRFLVPFIVFSFIFLVVRYPIDFQKVLYGGNHIIQFLPWLQEFANNFGSNIYPFFSFNINFGQDILAESQQAVAHPIKIILLFFFEAWQANSIFLIAHAFILFFGIYYFIKDYVPISVAIMISLLGFINIGTVLNTAHPFVLSVIAYLPIQLLILKKYNFNSSFKINLFFLTVINIFALLCGHYQIQFFTLFSLMLFSFFRAKESPYVITLFFTSCAFAFLICSFQLLPTLGLILDSSRSGPGGLNKFVGSASPLTWFNYLTPTVGWELEKFNYSVTRMFGRHISIENIHYLGIFPIILLFASFIKDKGNKNLEKYEDSNIKFLIAFNIFKALGVFIFLNILLNFLPIFGQFRIPSRNLFIFDIFVLIFIALNFKNFSFFKIDQAFKIVAFIIFFSLCGHSIPILVGFQEGDLSFTSEDLILLIFPIIFFTILLLSYIFLKYKNIGIRSSLSILFFITIFEVFFAGNILPKYYYEVDSVSYEDSQEKIDKFCQNDKLLLGQMWPNFNKPIFWGSGLNERIIGKDSKAFYPPSGDKCLLNHELVSSTISQEWLKELNYLLQDLDPIDKSNLASILGFKLIEGADKEEVFLSIEPSTQTRTHSINTSLKTKSLEIINVDVRKFSWQKDFSLSLYRNLNKYNLLKLLPSSRINTFELGKEKFLPLANNYDYILVDTNHNIIKYDDSKSLVKVNAFPGNEVLVYFIPVLFTAGLIISISTIFIFLILLSSKPIIFFDSFYLKLISKTNLSESFKNLGILILSLINKYRIMLNNLSVLTFLIILMTLGFSIFSFVGTEFEQYIYTFILCSILYFSFFCSLFFSFRMLKSLKGISMPLTSFFFLNFALGQVICMFLAITPLYLLVRNLVFSVL